MKYEVNAGNYLSDAKSYEKKGYVDAALAAYDRAIEKVPSAHAYVSRAKLYEKKGDREHAKIDYRAAERLTELEGRSIVDRVLSQLLVMVEGLRQAAPSSQTAQSAWPSADSEEKPPGSASLSDGLSRPVPQTAQAPTGASCPSGLKRIALVVGNGAYPGAHLSNPINDADDVTALLRDRLCFRVIKAKDADFGAFSQRLSEFIEAADGADVALFYFAGHGMQFQQTNYLLPVDAKPASEIDVVQRTISAQNIADALEPRAKVSLVFLDACRSNPIEDAFHRKMRSLQRSFSLTRGLAPMTTNGGETLIVYATRQNQQAADGSGRNSPFTRAFLEHFATPGKDVELIMRDVTSRVLELTGGRQTPQRLTELRHGLVLMPAR
jgi:hypothetical protein